MRCWTGFLAGLSLLALIGVGCCDHVAGICDCCCGGGCGLGPAGPVPVGAVPAGPVMPYAPISYPTSASAMSDVAEDHTVVPVTVHMPPPVIHNAE